MIAADPGQGGATWAVLQYVLGLRELGHDVFLVEPIAPGSIQPAAAPLASSVNARYFQDVVARFGLQGRAALLRQDTRETVGLPYVRAAPRRRGRRPADQHLGHVAGAGSSAIGFRAACTSTSIRRSISCGTQSRASTSGSTGIRITSPSAIALAGLRATCRRAAGRGSRRFSRSCFRSGRCREETAAAPWTTVGNWRGYGSIQYQGRHFGQKAHSLRRFMAVPRRTSERFLLALAIHPAEADDLAALKDNGWGLVDPAAVAATPDDYRAFIHASKAEFGIAKSGYVVSRSGWFSDRSVCYLASGRPVLAQDTGLSGIIPTGCGLVTFSTRRRSDCRDRGDQPQLRRSRQGGARTGRVVLRFEVRAESPAGRGEPVSSGTPIPVDVEDADIARAVDEWLAHGQSWRVRRPPAPPTLGVRHQRAPGAGHRRHRRRPRARPRAEAPGTETRHRAGAARQAVLRRSIHGVRSKCTGGCWRRCESDPLWSGRGLRRRPTPTGCCWSTSAVPACSKWGRRRRGPPPRIGWVRFIARPDTIDSAAVRHAAGLIECRPRLVPRLDRPGAPVLRRRWSIAVPS